MNEKFTHADECSGLDMAKMRLSAASNAFCVLMDLLEEGTRPIAPQKLLDLLRPIQGEVDGALDEVSTLL